MRREKLLETFQTAADKGKNKRLAQGGGCASCGEPLKLSVVIPARNEGPEVWKTLGSLAGAVVNMEFEPIIVDDHSNDNSCDFVGLLPDVKLIQQGGVVGAGVCRNDGYEMSTGDVVGFFDSHMRAQYAGLDRLARMARDTEAIICASSIGFEKVVAFQGWGCTLRYNGSHDLLEPKWVTERPEEEWQPIACPMGSGYFMSRQIAERLKAPTGQLWENTAGRWGFWEQNIAVKAFLLDIPILMGRAVRLRHDYRRVSRGSGPTGNAIRAVGYWKNLIRTLSILLDPAVYAAYVAEVAHSMVPRSDLAAILAETSALREIMPADWRKKPSEAVFTELCSEKVA